MPVTCDKVGNRIHFTWDGNRDQWRARLLAAKQLPGARFNDTDGGGKYWTAPLTMQTCRDLRALYGPDLRIGPALWRWANEQQRMTQKTQGLHQVDRSAFTNATLEWLPALAPTLHKAMRNRPFQLPAVRFAATLGATANGDDPGLGKTLVGIGAMLEAHPQGGVFLVVCPRTSVHLVWEREIERWTADVPGGVKVWAARGSRQRREETIERFERSLRTSRARWNVLVINFEMLETEMLYRCPDKEHTCPMEQAGWDCELLYNDDDCLHTLRKWLGGTKKMFKAWKELHPYAAANGKRHEYPVLFTRSWDGLIVDEAHKVLIRNSGDDTLVRRGLMNLRQQEGGLRLALSGSMMRGKPHNVWGTLNWLLPKQYTSFWHFVDSYIESSKNGYGRDIGDIRPDREEAFYRELDGFLIRRTADELHTIDPSWAPPPRSYFDVWCEMEAKQAKAYEEMKRAASANLDGKTLLANGVLAELTRLRQFASAYGTLDDDGEFNPAMPSSKYVRVLDKLADLGITGDKDAVGTNKVVIGSFSTRLINLFAKHLRAEGIECLVLTGETSDRERDRQVKRFQEAGGPRVFLLNTTAGGVSITLDKYADDLFVLDETWIPDDQEQLEKRVHRTSNTAHKVRIWYFLTEGTIDEDMRAITDDRDITQRKHLDGRRGVEFAKKRFNVRVTAA